MPRGARLGSEAGLYHAIIRGNNKASLFHHRDDFEAFLKILSDSRDKFSIKIHHYCLMTNHVHVLVWAPDTLTLGRFMHRIQRSYHHYYRKNHHWFGHLFQGRFRSLPIETEAYLLDCGRYIERNPVRAKLVQDPRDWPYSSYKVYACGFNDCLVDHSVAYLSLANDEQTRQKLYREHVETIRPYETLLDKELVGV